MAGRIVRSGWANKRAVMNTLPFAASFDALAFIVKHIRAAAATPHAVDMVPALSFYFNRCSWDKETGAIMENIPYEHFLIGWHHADDVADAVEVDILGRSVFVSSETLKRLAGKQL